MTLNLLMAGRLILALLLASSLVSGTAALKSAHETRITAAPDGSGCVGTVSWLPPVQDEERLAVSSTEVWAEPDVPQSDRSNIDAGLLAVQSELEKHLNSGLPDGVCIDVRASFDGPVGSAEAEGNRIVILTTPTGWPEDPSSRLEFVTAHEYVHTWEAATGGSAYAATPVWLVEGAADWLAWQSMLDCGAATSEQVAETEKMPHGPLVPRLQMLESPQGWSETLAPYAEAFQAVQMLMSGSEPSALSTYFKAVGRGYAWPDAFQQAFGLTPADFNQMFQAELTPNEPLP